MDDERFYEEVVAEHRPRSTPGGTLGESTRGVSGDANLTKALYLKLRVQQMIEAEQA